jgi:hypothetical protein
LATQSLCFIGTKYRWNYLLVYTIALVVIAKSLFAVLVIAIIFIVDQRVRVHRGKNRALWLQSDIKKPTVDDLRTLYVSSIIAVAKKIK